MSETHIWHSTTTEDVLAHHNIAIESGLTADQAIQNSLIYGKNQIRQENPRSPLHILLAQFKDFMVLVLLGAALVAGLMGEPEDTVAIIAIVIMNAGIGFFQEYRAEKAVQALKKLAAPLARVRRDGKIFMVPTYDLVPGDVVFLEAGNLVPADLRIIESFNMQVDESSLTGESVAVEKSSQTLSAETLPLGDQSNMTFKGTLITVGRGLGVVVRTGMQTELGKIAKLLQEEVDVKTPLQMRIADFAKTLTYIVAGLCAFIFVFGLIRGENPVLMFMTALSLAVAAIPEALPAVIAVTLALGARNMARNNALIRKLPAVEALGSVTYICTDKTGTLTENRMQAQDLVIDGIWFNSSKLDPKTTPSHLEFLQAMVLNNDATIEAGAEANGDPTEIALLNLGLNFGMTKRTLEAELPRVAELPFSSERGMMTTIHSSPKETVVYSKGAPERILPLCNLSQEQSSKYQSLVKEMAQKGLRVLAVAKRNLPLNSKHIDLGEVETEFQLLGLIGLIDPPRAEAKKAVAECQSAGIKVVMITGDHPQTAAAIARSLGLLTDDRNEVISGAQLDKMSDSELEKHIRRVSVFARVAPEQKIRLVKALQAVGEIASMTGDGVNDAPALRRADVGVSMGKGGTDVAREASHIILLDDNFGSIVAAVREGRRIYDNIRKFVRFALAGNSGEILTLFLAPFFGLPTPLLPIHILWVNLVTDGLPGIALAMEREEGSLMSRPPRAPQESLFARGLWQHVVWVGLLIAGLTLGVQWWALKTGSPNWQTMTFVVLTLAQMGHVFAIRSEYSSVLKLGLFSNIPLLAAVVGTTALQIAVVYLPPFQKVLKTQALSLNEFLICVMIPFLVFAAVEFEKWLVRFKNRTPSSDALAHGRPHASQ